MAKNAAHPSGDDRYKAVDLTIKRFRYEKDALLEVLNTTQETFGYLSEDLLIYISNNLNVPMSQIYGVATFYHLFTFEPKGEHNCVICTGTACHVKGSAGIVDALAAMLDIAAGDTTSDGFFSLTTARCLGSCGLAPVLVLDGSVNGKQTPETAIEEVQAIFAQQKAKKETESEAA
ncbi:MAG: bidirectional hydrogenase complex protein HoxE [Anaerolineales bacterium]|nr:bidirectional hydrogenase complex protein HoxE [Anaerolineales bacterium]